MPIYCYYVYAYIRSKDSKTAKAGTPYYIGKGKGKRAWSRQHTISIPKDKRYIILESNLTEIGALALERRYIRWFGRKDNSTGILLNFTDGGDGTSGIIFTEERKAAIGNFHRGRKRPPREPMLEETKEKIKQANAGKKLSAETREKMRESHKNRPPISDETRKKISEAKKGKPCKRSKEAQKRVNENRKPMSEETKEKIRQGNLGKKKNRRK